MSLERRLSSWRFSLLFSAFIVVAVAFGILTPTRSACANNGGGATAYPALPVCDPHYFKTLREKGWMEAMREVQVNNTVIAKPASVLAISCFDQHLKQVSQGGSTFTNSGQSQSDITAAINAAVGSSFTNFIKDNFKEPPTGAGTSFSSGGSYGGCTRLWDAWEKIKCAVVDNDSSKGGFLMSSLDQHRTNAGASGLDVRGSTGTPDCKGVVPKSRYEEGMKSSSDLAGTGKERYGSEEDAKKYFSFVHPNYCAYDPKVGSALGDGKICKLGQNEGKSCKEMPAVPTGLIVAYVGGKNAAKDLFENDVGTLYWTYRCLNPGCYFDVKDNASSIKFSSGGTPPEMKCTNKPYEVNSGSGSRT